jgi:hypothetical protein
MLIRTYIQHGHDEFRAVFRQGTPGQRLGAAVPDRPRALPRGTQVSVGADTRNSPTGQTGLLQAARWLPERNVIAVVDSSYAVSDC